MLRVKFNFSHFLWLIFLSIPAIQCSNKMGVADTLESTKLKTFDEPSNFFIQGWVPKLFSAPQFTDAYKPAEASSVTINIDATQVINKISPYLYGSNANTFSGQMVGEQRLLDKIKELNPGIIRYPGGDMSDTYFWNEANNQLPIDIPAKVFISKGEKTSSYFWYGKNTEPWTLTLDNYYLMLQKTNSTGLITVNYGYARYGTGKNPAQTAAHLAADWVRYDRGRTKYWEVGNENYGYWESGWKIDKSINKDGQPEIITGELYGQHFKIFADSMRKAAKEVGSTIFIGAQLIARPTPNSDNPAEADWNRGYFSSAGDAADYYVLHNYYTNYGENSSAKTILNSALSETQEIRNYTQQSIASNDREQKPMAMTEWNIFAVGSKQRVSQIAGVHAVLTLGEMIKANISMSTRFNLLGKYNNGDDFASISIGDEPDNPIKWNPRPDFYYMYYFSRLIGDQMVGSTVAGNNDIICYASKYSSGNAIGAIVVNKGNQDQVVSIQVANSEKLKKYYYYVLSGEKNKEFSRKLFINGQGPSGASGGPDHYQSIPAYSSLVNDGIKVAVPQNSVVYLVADTQ